MNRRDFLKTTAVAGTALALTGPYFLNADDKGGSKNVVIGEGEHKYECIHNWGELPASVEWQTTHNVAVDAAGLIYITHQGIGKVMDTVLVFDPKGRLCVAASYGGRKGVFRLEEGKRPQQIVSGPGIVGLAFLRTRELVVATTSELYRVPTADWINR